MTEKEKLGPQGLNDFLDQSLKVGNDKSGPQGLTHFKQSMCFNQFGSGPGIGTQGAITNALRPFSNPVVPYFNQNWTVGNQSGSILEIFSGLSGIPFTGTFAFSAGLTVEVDAEVNNVRIISSLKGPQQPIGTDFIIYDGPGKPTSSGVVVPVSSVCYQVNGPEAFQGQILQFALYALGVEVTLNSCVETCAVKDITYTGTLTYSDQ